MNKELNSLKIHLKKIREDGEIGPITKLYWQYLYEINLNYILANTRKNDKILDVGCGTGKYLIGLAKKDRICYGIDPLIELSLNKARKRAEEEKVNINLIQGVGEDIPFPSKFFDAVLCLSTLQHVNNPNRTLSEINRVLVDNGILLISIPLEKTIFNFFRNISKPAYYAHLFSINELKKLIKKNNFDILKIRGCGFFPPFLDKILFRFYPLFKEKATLKIIKSLDIFTKIIPSAASSIIVLARAKK